MFLLIGRYIEAYSKSRTGDAITSLANLKPAEALVVALAGKKDPLACYASVDEDIEMGKADTEAEEQISEPGSIIQKVPVDLLEIGDVVRVPSGSTPPRDGIVASGHTLFDESSVTGESKPIKKNPGDQVFLGTINIGQAIDVRIDVAEGKTMLDHVINVVRDSQTKRAPIERIADILTGYFVPVVTLLALLTWAIWLSLGLSGALPRSYLDKDVGGWRECRLLWIECVINSLFTSGVDPRVRDRCLYRCMSMWYWPRSPNRPSGWYRYCSEIRHLGSRRGRGLSGGSAARRCRL